MDGVALLVAIFFFAVCLWLDGRGARRAQRPRPRQTAHTLQLRAGSRLEPYPDGPRI